MAQIEQSSGGKQKKGAQKKMQIHVDFTPMVDMNMLLITFFMLCTTMLKSQTLNIMLPSNEKVTNKDQMTQAKADNAFTIIVDSKPSLTERFNRVRLLPTTFITIKVKALMKAEQFSLLLKSRLSIGRQMSTLVLWTISVASLRKSTKMF